ERNGVVLQPLSRDEILEGAPYVTEEVRSGVLVEGEGVIDPFWTTRAYCESAVQNGAEVYLEHAVTGVDVTDQGAMVFTDAGTAFHTGMVINAAGLWSDEIARLAGDESFCLTPRKGQF